MEIVNQTSTGDSTSTRQQELQSATSDDDVLQRARERKQKIEERRIESDKRVSEYFRKLNSQAPHQQVLTPEAFAQRLAKQRIEPDPITDLHATAEQIAPYLRKAYEYEVTLRGRAYEKTEFTEQVICKVARWMAERPKPGLILRGNIGVGKTTMLRAMSDVYQVSKGRPIVIKDSMRLVQMYIEDKNSYENAKNAPLLGLDDMGVEPRSIKSFGNEITPIMELIYHRYEKRMFTIVTTNLVVTNQNNEFEDLYGQRIADRIKEHFNTLKFGEERSSYRQ